MQPNAEGIVAGFLATAVERASSHQPTATALLRAVAEADALARQASHHVSARSHGVRIAAEEVGSLIVCAVLRSPPSLPCGRCPRSLIVITLS